MALEPGHAAAAAAAVARAVAAEAAAVDAAGRAGKAEAAAYAASKELERLRSTAGGGAGITAARADAAGAGASRAAAAAPRRRHSDHRMSLDRPSLSERSEDPVVSPSGVSENGLFHEKEQEDKEEEVELEVERKRGREPRRLPRNNASNRPPSAVDDASKLNDALCEASKAGDLPQLKALLQHPTAHSVLNGNRFKSDINSEVGMPPLAWAARENQSEAAELLLKAGAPINGGNSPDSGDGGNVGTSWSLPPLFAAAEAGAEETLALLLRWGADPNSPSNWGPGYRVANEDGGSHTDGTPPVLAAVLGGHADCLARLLHDGGANPEGACTSSGSSSQGNKRGTRPLFAAAATGNYPAAQLLVDHGAKVDLPSGNGRSRNLTPLYIAAHQGHADVVQLLLERGAHPQGSASQSLQPPSQQPHAITRSGRHSASAQNSGGAAANQKTPLHAAASRGHVEAVSALLAGGAGLARLDGKNRTPEQCALSNGHTACAALLSDARRSLEGHESLLEDGYPTKARGRRRAPALGTAAEAAPPQGLPHQRLWRAPPARRLEAFVDNNDDEDMEDEEYNNDSDDEAYSRLMLRPHSPNSSPRSPRALRRLAAGNKEPLTPPPHTLSPASRFYGISASVLSSMR